jgi:hypothetical protein
MTPLLGMSWAFDELWEHRHEGWIFTTVADMDLNTTLSTDAKKEALRGASKAELEARKRGLFVHFRGLVLANFSDDLKVPAVLPSHLRGQDVYVGIDPGIAQGGVVWAAFDRDNRMLVFDELYPENETVPQIARQIKAKNSIGGFRMTSRTSLTLRPVIVSTPMLRTWRELWPVRGSSAFTGRTTGRLVFFSCEPGATLRLS